MDKYLQTSSALFGSLKNAVLGNPVTREYQVGPQVASFGPGLCWKVFEGKKKTTGQDVSVFVLEKKILDTYEKKEREPILEMFRKGPQQLAKLRHPRLLTIQHTIEESRDSLAFATEPVFASLANILGKHENIPNAVQENLKAYELYDVEKVYGLLQITEGLAFLHNDVKMIEGNVTPNNIVITKDGQWKLAGFNFCLTVQRSQEAFNWEIRMPVIAKPELNYLAPEYILSQSCELASDMFSFGCLMNAVYNKMKTPFDAGNSIESYKRCIEQLCRLGSDYMRDIPIAVRDHVKCLLNIAPGVRPDANQTIKHEFFDDVAAMTLKYLHSLVQRDDMTKSQFFKNLHRVLKKLPKRVVHQRVLPHLFLEFPNHAMIPFVLPNVLLIAEDCTNEEFTELVLPELKKIFSVQEPIQVLLMFMQKMELLLKKTPPADVKSYVLPMVFRALESQSVQIGELVLGIIPSFAHMIDYSSLKNCIIPRVKALALKTQSLSVRVNALLCIGKIIDYLDKFVMIDDIFPVLPQIPSKEPAVLMAILGIYKATVSHKKMHLEKDYLATKAVPFLLPLAVDASLNVSQFNNFMSVIRDMLDRIDQEHRTKLEQLSQMQEQQKSALEFSKAVEDSSDMKEMLAKVDKLVLGDPDKDADASNLSQFSKIFGIVNEDASKSRKSNTELMAHSTANTTANADTVLTANTTLNAKTTIAMKDLTSTISYQSYSSPSLNQIPSDRSMLTSKQTSDNSSLMRNIPTQTQMQTLSGKPTNSLSQYSQRAYNSATVESKSPLIDSMMARNTSMQAKNDGPVITHAAPKQFNPDSLNSVLMPEMKQFSSNQPKMSLNAMQHQQQGLEQPLKNLGSNGAWEGYKQMQPTTFPVLQPHSLQGGKATLQTGSVSNQQFTAPNLQNSNLYQTGPSSNHGQNPNQMLTSYNQFNSGSTQQYLGLNIPNSSSTQLYSGFAEPTAGSYLPSNQSGIPKGTQSQEFDAKNINYNSDLNDLLI